jgi:hypothetical protein
VGELIYLWYLYYVHSTKTYVPFCIIQNTQDSEDMSTHVVLNGCIPLMCVINRVVIKVVLRYISTYTVGSVHIHVMSKFTTTTTTTTSSLF